MYAALLGYYEMLCSCAVKTLSAHHILATSSFNMYNINRAIGAGTVNLSHFRYRFLHAEHTMSIAERVRCDLST